MDYKEICTYETSTKHGTFGIKLLVLTARTIGRDESFDIQRKTEKILEGIMAESLRIDPEETQQRMQERLKIRALFPAMIYIEEIPNAYCDQWCCRHRPWFVVTTPLGRIKIGWRKNVIQIDWSDSIILPSAEELFPDEDVTKSGRIIHAWGYDKAERYLRILMAVPIASVNK